MTGVWAILTVITIFMGLPAILGTYLAAEYGGPRLVRIWVTVMAASLIVALVLTAVVMFAF